MTLLLVAALSAVAVAMSDSLRIAARRSANAAARDQALWHLLGAEELARQMLRRDFEASPERTTLDAVWARGPAVFPIEGGRIEGVVTDRSNCFNLNSLALPDERGRYGINPEARDELQALAAALEAPAGDAAQLAASAADWVDANDVPDGRGAEDFDYALAAPPYRAANTLFAEVEEARALLGVSEPVFRAVRPWLCAYPDTSPARLNVNTLRAEDAPLLSALFAGALTTEAARDLIESRPAGGWTTLEEVWAEEPLAAVAASEGANGRLALTSAFFQLDARVYYNGAYAESTSFLAQTGGVVRVVRRRIGAAE
jgi:general secretion pathway protein K